MNVSEMPGVYLGVVKNNKLDAEGRIEITLEGVSGNVDSYFARVSTLMAGNERGTLFLPEVDDQVLVAFVNGSVNGDPVIIGSIWSAQDKPPDYNDNGENDLKLIKTRSGNQISFVDTDGEETIEIQTPHGRKITIKSDPGEITITADTITLEGNTHITGTLDIGTVSKTHIEGNAITGQENDRSDI